MKEKKQSNYVLNTNMNKITQEGFIPETMSEFANAKLHQIIFG